MVFRGGTPSGCLARGQPYAVRARIVDSRWKGAAVMSDDTKDTKDETPSGTAETPSNHAKLEVNLDPTAIAELVGKHGADASEETKSAAGSSSATHDLSIKVSDMTWGEFQSKVGTTNFLSEADVSLTPASGTDPLHANLHADLIKQNWGQIAGVGLATDLSGGVKWTDGKGVGENFSVEQDVKFKSATLTGTVTTDFSSGTPSVSGTVGLKLEF